MATIPIGGSWYQYDVEKLGTSYGSSPNKMANPNLTWEKAEMTDIGLDARLFNNRLTFTVEYFDKRTKDLLFDVPIASELGFSSYVANGGSVQNRGWEFELGWKDTIGDFSYSISGNLSTLHNEVLSLAEGSTPIRRSDASSTNYPIQTVFEVGYPIWYLCGYEYEGVNPADGTFSLKDQNGDGEISNEDMKYIGQTTPKFTYGLNINMAWKGFDLAIYGSGLGGNSILPVLWRPGFKNHLKYYLDNAWTPDNKNGTLPYPEYSAGNLQFWSSTANLFKGDFFRIKQLQLGYTLPARITNKIAISNLRFYVSLDDFFTFTKYPGLDPETASTNNYTGAGLDWGSYPTMQKLLLGVNITF